MSLISTPCCIHVASEADQVQEGGGQRCGAQKCIGDTSGCGCKGPHPPSAPEAAPRSISPAPSFVPDSESGALPRNHRADGPTTTTPRRWRREQQFAFLPHIPNPSSTPHSVLPSRPQHRSSPCRTPYAAQRTRTSSKSTTFVTNLTHLRQLLCRSFSSTSAPAPSPWAVSRWR